MALMKKFDLNSQNASETRLALALIFLGVLCRVLPHPDNVTPTAALALFAGVTLSPALAFTVPLLVMMASDLFIGFHPLFWLVWPTFALVTWIGHAVREKEGALPIMLASFGSSALFFAVSNLGVFFFEQMYPRTFAGLAECFTMALPFFRNSLIGDLTYTAVAFAFFAMAAKRLRAIPQS